MGCLQWTSTQFSFHNYYTKILKREKKTLKIVSIECQRLSRLCQGFYVYCSVFYVYCTIFYVYCTVYNQIKFKVTDCTLKTRSLLLGPVYLHK